MQMTASGEPQDLLFTGKRYLFPLISQERVTDKETGSGQHLDNTLP